MARRPIFAQSLGYAALCCFVRFSFFASRSFIDYHGLLNVVVVLALLGLLLVWLWQIGLDLVRSSQPRRRVGGWLLLAVAATLAVGLVGFVYWESQLVWSLLD